MIPKYTISDISGNKMRFGQEKVIPELQRHGHKTCMVMPNGKQRYTKQSINELISHYEKYHF